ncbi:hypothetical protein VTL71DRAFT_5280 [Oculimacula yallundae]|uniref:Uncharacterized protein n=1 Tax=Oculimacula yallundae TaxID=86028 RepID=A0ABR4C1A2_9HELO
MLDTVSVYRGTPDSDGCIRASCLLVDVLMARRFFCPSGRFARKRQKVPGYRVSIRSRDATQQTKDKQNDTVMQK